MDNDFIQWVGANSPSIIKVIGVGGGGDNAVAHMYTCGNIPEVNYLVCNTDKKALDISPVPHQLQLGNDGLGAGGDPLKGRELAEESVEAICREFDEDTKMVFVTAGMGGGTGTGASPVIAREARQRGILTVGIVTIPFRFEGTRQIDKALDGVDELAKSVDAILVINNERLRAIYPDLSLTDAFAHADDTLTNAVHSIVDIITMHGKIHLDFRDANMVLRDGGVAIMSTGYAEGENRLTRAITSVLNSPLSNNRDIFRAKRMLISVTTSSAYPLRMDEIDELTAFTENFVDKYIESKFGLATDDSLGAKIKINILASGFGIKDIDRDAPKDSNVILYTEDDILRITRRNSIYGELGKQKRRAPRRIFLFSPADLDNEALADMLDATPTYHRSADQLEHIETLRRYDAVCEI